VGEGKREETQRLLDDSLRLAIGVIMPAIVLLIAIRHGVVGILFSDAFDPIARWLPIQLTGDAVRTVGWVLGVALVPLGLTRAWLVTGVGASILFAGVGSLFAAHWGLGGAASAWLITWTASTIAVVVVLIRKGFWRPSPRTIAGLLVTAAAVAATTAFPGAIGVAVSVLATAALGATLARPGERARILRSVAGLRRT
jgi:O-antigen/teichoic acid export membrane protein